MKQYVIYTSAMSTNAFSHYWKNESLIMLFINVQWSFYSEDKNFTLLVS